MAGCAGIRRGCYNKVNATDGGRAATGCVRVLVYAPRKSRSRARARARARVRKLAAEDNTTNSKKTDVVHTYTLYCKYVCVCVCTNDGDARQSCLRGFRTVRPFTSAHKPWIVVVQNTQRNVVRPNGRHYICWIILFCKT